MTYLIALFLPPIYFLTRKKWLGFTVSTFLMLVSITLYFTIFLIPVGLVLWLLTSVVAIWGVRKELMHEHATIIAEKMSQTLQQPSKMPSGPTR